MVIIQRRVVALILVVTVNVWPLPGFVSLALAGLESDWRFSTTSTLEFIQGSHFGRGLPADRFFAHHPGDPVNLRTGNLTLPGVDLSIPSRGPSLTLTRTYNSRSAAAGLFGQKWQSNLDVRALRLSGTIAIVEADGALVEFKPEGLAYRPSGSGLRYAGTLRGVEELEERPDGSLLRHTVAGNREAFDQRGRLVRIEDRNGNALRLEYQGNKMITMEDASGRILRFTYGGPDGRFVTMVTDPAAGVIRYQYDPKGRLINVTDQVGREGRYEYDGQDRLVRLLYADGAETRMTYEGKTGAIIAQHGPGPATTTYRYEWEPGGQLARRTTVTDTADRLTIYEYARGGQELTIIEPSGRRTTMLYDPDFHQLLSVSGRRGILASYQYDRSGRLLSETDALRRTTRYRYDVASGRLIEVADAAGHPVRFEYDEKGNRVALVRADGTKMRDTYDSRGQGIERIDPTGNRTRFAYDQAGNLTEQIDASGQKTRDEYDVLGRLVRRIGANGAETRWAYNGVGDLVKKVDAEGRQTAYQYDPMRRLAAVTDPAGRTTRYEYDRAGQLVAAVDPSGGRTVRSYTSDGHLREISDASGVVLRYEYDSLGRMIARIDGLDHRSRYEYDAGDHLVALHDPTGAELRVAYDPGGRPTDLLNASARTTLTYDPSGRVEAFTEPDGRTWRYRFGPSGKVTEVLDPAGGKAAYRYDAAGRLIEQIDPAGRGVRYSRDQLGRVVEIGDPNKQAIRLGYDSGGNLVAKHLPSGKEIRYRYDHLDRIVGVSYPDGSERRFEYDRAGNAVAVRQGEETFQYNYDALNRLVSVQYPRLNKMIRYAYDAAGRRTKMVDPSGGVTHYRYDAAGRLMELTPPDGATLRLAYDPAGRMTEIGYPNKVTGRISYDATGRVTIVRYERGGQSFAGSSYLYDTAGRIASATAADGSIERYGYDALSRLVTVADAKGNRAEYGYLPDGSRARSSSGTSSVSYGYDAVGRLTTAGGQTFRHDPDGSLIERKTSEGLTTYEYDADRRLVKVVFPNGETIAYGYDPDGQRFWRKGKEGITYYLHDGMNLLAELDGRLAVKAIYLHGEGLDAPLVMVRDGKTYYYHPDRSGSVLALTDDRGQVVASYKYDPFGAPVSLDAKVPNPFLFTAREYDQATALYQYRAREYDPTLGRFLTRDPLSGNLLDPRTLHPYVYVSNNPLSLIDPLGLAQFPQDADYIPGLRSSSGWLQPSDIDKITDPILRQSVIDQLKQASSTGGGIQGVRVNPTNPGTLEVWPKNGPPSVIYPEPLGGPVMMEGRVIPGVTPEPPPLTRPVGPLPPEPTAPTGAPGGGFAPGGLTVGNVLTGIAVVASVVHIATAENKPQATGEVAGGWVGAEFGAGVGVWLGPVGAVVGGVIGGVIGSITGGCIVGPCPPGAPPPYLSPVERPTGPTGSVPASGPSDGPISVISDQPPPPGPIVVPLPGGPQSGYGPIKDPGMGGGPPDTSGATDAGSAFQSGAPWGSGQQPPTGPTSGGTGGIVIEQPGLNAPPAGPTESGTVPGQQLPQQGVWCYSEKTGQSYQLPYGPCPSPHLPPPAGGTPHGPGAPWQRPAPSSGGDGGHGSGGGGGSKPPSGGGAGSSSKPPTQPTPACGPTTSCSCPDGKKGHIPCDKSKGKCHCGGG